MINASDLTQKITFEVMDNNEEWQFYCKAYAKITGLRNSEYWVNFAGGNADEYVNISVRYKKKLMDIVPQTARVVHGGNIYELISPPDDVLFVHTEIKFRARRQIS